jgi:hypothetical protein
LKDAGVGPLKQAVWLSYTHLLLVVTRRNSCGCAAAVVLEEGKLETGSLERVGQERDLCFYALNVSFKRAYYLASFLVGPSPHLLFQSEQRLLQFFTRSYGASAV